MGGPATALAGGAPPRPAAPLPAPEAAASTVDGVGGEEVAPPLAPAGAGAGSVDARDAPCSWPRPPG
eukprot:6405824-Alexandrium_andersonii.AAC.1